MRRQDARARLRAQARARARVRGTRALALTAAFQLALATAGCGTAERASERAEPSSPPPNASEPERPVVLFLGTSLTAAYGLPADGAFAARVQERIDAEGLGYRVVNAGVSGDTSAGGVARLDWLLRLPIAVLVVELGANDMLRGHDVDAMRRNLQEIFDRARAAHPQVRFVLAGMRAAPNLGAAYARRFDAVFPELARENGAALIPFLLEGVAADPALNQSDGIHPTAEGHVRIAATVWKELGPVLRMGAGG